MRWERLLDDLQAHVAQDEVAEHESEVAERVRTERSRLGLPARLRAHRGAVRLVLAHGRLVAGDLVDAGADWVEIAGDPRGRTIVPVRAIVQLDGLGWSTGSVDDVVGRLGLGHPLRRLARDREVVEVEDVLGRLLTGTIDAVGADAFDLALHRRDVPRRSANLIGRPTIAFGAVVCVTAVGLA